MARSKDLIFSKQLRKWRKDLEAGRGLPNLYTAPLKVFIIHRDTMIEKFEKFCKENNIELKVQ